jgi:hypothetical protein
MHHVAAHDACLVGCGFGRQTGTVVDVYDMHLLPGQQVSRPEFAAFGLAGAAELRAAVLSGLQEAGRDRAPVTFATNVVIRFGERKRDPRPAGSCSRGPPTR